MTRKKLFRIKNNDQFGSFEYNNDKLIINWNHWGQEIYHKYDDYNYYQENYNPEIYKSVYNNNVKLIIFIHITMIEDWLNIFSELINY